MATTQTSTMPSRCGVANDPTGSADSLREKGLAVPKQIGICAFYREDQLANGVYSFSENLMRGMDALSRASRYSSPFDVTVFHAPRGLRWTEGDLKYRQLSNRWGRVPSETKVGCFDSAGLDAVLFPHTFTPPVVRARRAITVIHDLQYLHYSQHWPLAKRLWMRSCHEVTLRKCDAVVAISQAVKDDILKQYGERWHSRVHSIWNPVAVGRFDSHAEQTFTNGRPYLLTTAVDRPVKNLASLIRAFALLRQRFPEHCLVMAGQLRSANRSWRRRNTKLEAKMPATVDLINELGLAEHVITTGFISDEQLGALYRGACAFVLPSLFEGFGMPAVESLALGAPTLITGLPVLREVTLGAAQYIEDPFDINEIAAQITDLLNAGDAARPSKELSREIRHRFAPETIAQQYLNLMLGV